MRRELISNALSERFRELCALRVSQLEPEKFGEMQPFVSQVREAMGDTSPTDINHPASGVGVPESWWASDTNCFSSLRALSLGSPLPLRAGQHPPIDAFIKSLDACRSDPERRFLLLAERYACPLNFSSPGEDKAREYLLTRLMVRDRAVIEKKSIEAVESSELLLRLNLVAVHATSGPDLRFLDALNYYYELLPVGWQPRGQFNWLLVSYFALYARALAAWI
jgi:hypothetical protein